MPTNITAVGDPQDFNHMQNAKSVFHPRGAKFKTINHQDLKYISIGQTHTFITLIITT